MCDLIVPPQEWIVSEMTYTVSSGTLNPSIPYHTTRVDNVMFRTYCPHVYACVLVFVSRELEKLWMDNADFGGFTVIRKWENVKNW